MERWFDADVAEVRALRRWVTDALVEQGCDSDAVDRAGLVATELAANVVEHTRSDRMGVAIDLRDGVAHVAVADCDPAGGAPEPPTGAVMSEGGRGLRIVAAMAVDWGVEVGRDRKTVWADVACERAP